MLNISSPSQLKPPDRGVSFTAHLNKCIVSFGDVLPASASQAGLSFPSSEVQMNKERGQLDSTEMPKKFHVSI